ncbi:phage distal tail protein [Streptomyces indicus]|uniref:Phage tail protein n=1 Tax=Streptomyces indicus TaxID=417292 RepID=A0A1G8W8F5_9ACTN|nr:phage tail domain-containing protein [Streptomyces indicus]SDJ74413.1 Phage tail protein [Streptomyces indicus]
MARLPLGEVKVTQDGQLQFGAYLMGETTPVHGRQLSGWDDLPDLDDATVPMPSAHGAWPGWLLAGPRVLVFDFLIYADNGLTGLPGVLEELHTATAVRQDESPLIVQLAGSRRLMWARVTRRTLPASRAYTWGKPTGSVQFTCADPRRYQVEEQVARTGLPEPEPGIDWHPTQPPPGIEWDLDYGAAGTPGAVLIDNTGDADTHPVLAITGPVTHPTVTNQATGATFEYDITLAATDRLVIDTQAGTVTLNDTAPRLYTATARSTPEQAFTLPPGDSLLTFRAAEFNPNGALTVLWRSAYW